MNPDSLCTQISTNTVMQPENYSDNHRPSQPHMQFWCLCTTSGPPKGLIHQGENGCETELLTHFCIFIKFARVLVRRSTTLQGIRQQGLYGIWGKSLEFSQNIYRRIRPCVSAVRSLHERFIKDMRSHCAHFQ